MTVPMHPSESQRELAGNPDRLHTLSNQMLLFCASAVSIAAGKKFLGDPQSGEEIVMGGATVAAGIGYVGVQIIRGEADLINGTSRRLY